MDIELQIKYNRFLYLLGFFLISLLYPESTIKVLTPNGGENFETSSNQVIQWKGSGKRTSFVNIYFSTNGGTDWEKLNFTQDDGSYVWEVPNSGYSNCLIKIENFRDTDDFDISDKPFTIAGPSILVVRPGPGDVLESRKMFEIEWQAIDLTSRSVKIFYSIDDGTNWELITNKTLNTSKYSWKIPDIYGSVNQCLIRVEEFGNATLHDISDGNFTILGVEPTIRITYPDINDILAANKEYTVTWESRHLKSDFVKLYYSTNNGISWKKLSTFTPDEGSLVWNTPDISSDLCLIRIEDAGDNNTSALSEGNFSVSKKPNIKLTAPKGGMELDPGVPYLISWESMNLSGDEVNIYYSLNGGTNWLSIAYEAKDTSSFSWFVPEFNVNKNKSVIKVEDVGNSEVLSQNEDVFVILGVPLIELLYPKGGELFPAKTTEVIQWRSSNLKDNIVQILLSSDGGMMWDVISSDVPDLGVYEWVIPEITSSRTILKIESPTNPNVFIQTEKYIRLTAEPLILIDAPIINDKWMPGGMQMIQWRSFNLPGKMVNIYYSKDNGNNWIPIITKLKNTGSYPLSTPKVIDPTDIARVKIEDYSNTSIHFKSEGNFSIVAPPILQINHPNENVVIPTNSNLAIQWDSFNNVGQYINLYYSLNGGIKWKKIQSDIPNSGSYNWKTPALNSTLETCLIKIRDSYNASTNDISDAEFTLKIPDPGITIYRPMISESISSGKKFNIEWTSISLSGKGVNLYYSIDNGNNWEDINDFSPDEGSFQWEVPKLDVPSDACQIMIQDAGGHTTVEISDNFSIGGYPEIKLNSPAKGETINTGSQQNINWESINITDKPVNLYFSIDKGKTWVNIGKRLPNTGTYSWQVPMIKKSSKKSKIKIELSDDNLITDITDKEFSIKVMNSSITLNTPNGGERLTMNETIPINWDSKDLSGKGIKLLYSINNGMKWTPIKNSVKNTGKYSWKVPKLKKAASKCMIKISDAGDNSISDISNGKFSIKFPSTIKITTPNGGERIKTKKGVYISWDAPKMEGDKVNIYYSTDDGSTWVETNKGVKNSGTIIWKVPNKKSKKCLIKVENTSDPEDFDISDRNFTIR